MGAISLDILCQSRVAVRCTKWGKYRIIVRIASRKVRCIHDRAPGGEGMKVYIASSWRNEFYPTVLETIRADGYEVYDFRDSAGAFHWSAVDPNWQNWTPEEYLHGLSHPFARDGFRRDMGALQTCDACVYVMPCGVSASMEMGWACGAGKPTVAYVPGVREPDLMISMANLVTTSLREVQSFLAVVYTNLHLHAVRP